MQSLIWIGAGISVLGLIGIIYCIVAAARLRGQGLDDDTTRERLRKLIPVNLASLLCSTLGLMLVIVGIFLG
ncbi:hypothetical protein [Mesobacterium pallidum]|uniref:hypothetical protein n=1 Tax=Mesobacterium pallidum TaxID=2872037 RepID=UPI001EE27ECD|nr:hypothetical protein [Mesobacterium pallidum]